MKTGLMLREIKRTGKVIAEEIRKRIKEELGITVSIGVSWNKILQNLVPIIKA